MALDLVAVDNYARALLSVAEGRERLEAVWEDARAFVELAEMRQEAQSRRLRVFLESPQVSVSEKHELLRNAFSGRVDPLLVDMLCLMVDRHRTDHFRDVMRRFCELVDERQGIFPGSVSTAQMLSGEEKEQLRARLESFTGAQLRLRYRTDPDLIGGVVFKYRDLLVDSTLRAGIDELRARLDGLRLRLPTPVIEEQ